MHRKTLLEEIKEYKDEIIRFDAILLKNTAQNIATAQASLKDAQKRRRHRPLETLFEKVLDDYGIKFEQHFTMTLTGKPIGQLLKHHERILERIEEILPVEVRASRRIPLSRLKECLASLDFLCSKMNKMDKLSKGEIELFGVVSKAFGVRYRMCLNKGATHKVHLLESHMYEFLKKYGRLGVFTEQLIEVEHAKTNLWMRKFNNIKDWATKINFLDRRRNVREMFAIQQQQTIIHTKTKKNLPPAITLRRANVKQQAQDTRLEKQIEKVGSFVNSG